MASTHLSPRLQTSKQVAWTATLAQGGVGYFAVMIVVLHFLRPDLNPIQRPTSEYAVGPYGWLMTSAFFSMSVASFALALGLAHGLVRPARSWMGLGLVGAWGVGVLIAMLFPIDPDGAAPTLAGAMHRINGPVAFLCLTAGVLLLSRRLTQDERWRPFHRSALRLSLVMLALFVGTFLSIVTEAGVVGLSQRLYLATCVTWFLLAATRLRSVARDARSA